MTDNNAAREATKARCMLPEYQVDQLLDIYEEHLQRQTRDNDAKAMALLNSLFYYDEQNDVHVFAYAEPRIIVRDDEHLTQLYDAVERLNTQEQS